MPDLYRFRGSVRPTEGTRASVLNFAPSGPQEEPGVAVMRLFDPIDSWGGEWGVSAKEFAAALDGLPEDTHTIRLHLNSPGGEVFEAVTILNMLRRHKARVVAVVDGLAASAASFLAAGADELVMGRNSQLMIHDAWGLGIGNAADMRELAGRLDALSDNIASIYAAKAGGDVADWRGHMLAETWYSADEALEAGLADSVEASEPQPVNSFDLSAFKHAGRADAPPPHILTPDARAFAEDHARRSLSLRAKPRRG